MNRRTIAERDRLVVGVETGMDRHWLLAPICVKVAPWAAVPKPRNCSESPAAAPLPMKSTTMSPLACPVWNAKMSLPVLPGKLVGARTAVQRLAPALPNMPLASALPFHHIAGALKHEVLDVRRQGVGDAGVNTASLPSFRFSTTPSLALSTK